jgi:hypothetical protein
MRKIIITITILALILSTVGTGIMIYFETTAPSTETQSI